MGVNLSPALQEDPVGILWPLDPIDPWDSLQFQLARAGVGLAHSYCTPHTRHPGQDLDAPKGSPVGYLNVRSQGLRLLSVWRTVSLYSRLSSPHLSRANS